MIALPNALRSMTPWLIAALVVSLTACQATPSSPPASPVPGQTASPQSPQPTATTPPAPVGTPTPEPPSIGKVGDTLEQRGWKMRVTSVESLTAEQATQANNGTPLAGALYVVSITVENTAVGANSLGLSDFQLDLSGGDQFPKPINCCAAYATQRGGAALVGLRIFQARERANLVLFINRPAGLNAEVFRFTDGKGLRWTITS